MTDLKAALARLERDLDVAGAQLRAAQGRYDELKIACWGLRLAMDRYGPDADCAVTGSDAQREGT